MRKKGQSYMGTITLMNSEAEIVERYKYVRRVRRDAKIKFWKYKYGERFNTMMLQIAPLLNETKINKINLLLCEN